MSTLKIYYNETIFRTTQNIESFNHLRHIVSSKINAFRPELKYIDEDGDLISLNDDADWNECLRSNYPVIKIHVVSATAKLGPLVLVRQNKEEEEVKEEEKVETQMNEEVAKTPLVIRVVRIVEEEEEEEEEEEDEVETEMHDAEVARHAYYALFPEIMTLMDGGLSDLNKALDLLKEQLVLVPQDPIATYNVACVYSLMGDPQRAIDKLNEAIEYGYHKYEFMMNDPDLACARLLDTFPTNPKLDEEEISFDESYDTEYEEEMLCFDESYETSEEYEEELLEECEVSEQGKGEEYESDVAALAAMGFSVERARIALDEAEYDPAEAVAMLVGSVRF